MDISVLSVIFINKCLCESVLFKYCDIDLYAGNRLYIYRKLKVETVYYSVLCNINCTTILKNVTTEFKRTGVTRC